MRKVFALALFAAAVGQALTPAAAHAAPQTAARYHGHIIDLASGWHGAQACAVLSGTDVRCFDSQAELERALHFGQGLRAGGGTGGVTPSTIDTYCLNRSDLWLTIYESTSFGGRALSFRDTGYWQNLSAYSFDNMMSSWVNSTYCDALASVDADGGGSWLTMAARSSNSNVGSSWDNVASSIFITS